MTIIEEFLSDYEREEDSKDMHWSTYFIPEYAQEEINGET